MALAENIEREDLTPIEEAWGFAEGVTVEVDGEEMSYAEYVENLRENTCVPGNNSVILPSEKDRDVETEAEATPRSVSYVRDHVRFLTLPESIRDQIAAGDFPKRAARLIVRTTADTIEGRDEVIRALADSFEDGVGNADWSKFKALYQQLEIPDADAKTEAIRRITDRVGGNITADDVTEDRIERLIDNEEQRYEERQGLKLEELEEQQQVVANREDDMLAELTDAAAFAREEFGETFSFGQVDESTAKDDIDEIYDEVKKRLSTLKNDLNQTANNAGQQVDDLNSRAAKLERALDILREEERVDTDGDWWADLRQTHTGLNDDVEKHEEEQSEALAQHREVRDTLDNLSRQYRELERSRKDLAELQVEVETDG